MKERNERKTGKEEEKKKAMYKVKVQLVINDVII